MRIIAVFGPTERKTGPAVPGELLRAARDAGARIAAAGHILLTGGDRPGDKSVKDVAIAGAGGGPWAGVLKGGVHAPPPWVIGSGLEDQRNFLEALMCDAAIAFPSSGPGTRAEVACAFALQRPVAFVGEDRWRAIYDLDRDATRLLQDAQSFFAQAKPPAVPDPDFDERLRSCLDPTRAPHLLREAQAQTHDKRPYRYFDLPEDGDMSEVVDWAASVPLPSGAPRREVPAIKALERTCPDGQTIRDRFLAWLTEIEQAS
jgi:hypothetical protein